MRQIKGNVISKKIFNDRMSKVLDYTANAVSKTLGPYGHNVLIQTTDRVETTKDGWNVLQSITFDNILDNSIKSMIESVAQSVVLKVGDGTTTATIAANDLNKLAIANLTDTDNNWSIRDIETIMTQCVDNVISKLREQAIPITKENLGEAIKKIAMVSTNWDENLSQIISDIYVKTENPIIKVQPSGTDKTTVSYIEGYDLTGNLLLPDYYLTDRDNATCVLKTPKIIVIDYTVPKNMVTSLTFLSEIVGQYGQQLVIMAPGYEPTFLQQIKANNLERTRRMMPITNIVPVKYVNNFNIDKECVEDFCILTGAIMIPKTNEDFTEFLDDLTKTMIMKETGIESEDIIIKESKQSMMSTAIEYLNQFCGTCNKLTINDKYILAEGLTASNTELIEKRKDKIINEITMKTKECDALTMLTEDIRIKRIRLGKLQCNMGIINIGGFGDANLKARKDAVDDATRACEAAYRDGYTVGSTIAIAIAVRECYNNSTDDADQLVYSLLFSAFRTVFETLLINKRGVVDTEQVDAIHDDCIDNRCGYNVLTDSLDNDTVIINPVNVDIEVLKGCLRLVLISLTSDQFIYKNYEGFDIMGETNKKVSEYDDSNVKVSAEYVKPAVNVE